MIVELRWLDEKRGTPWRSASSSISTGTGSPFVQTTHAGEGRYTFVWNTLHPSWMGTPRVSGNPEWSAGLEAVEQTLVPLKEPVQFPAERFTYELFTQERVGKDGSKFTLMKFRSMRSDAEKLTGPVWATEHDPRITKVGRFIRKTRLDELPQLFNVLAGSMSLVGPRPEREHFVTELSQKIPYYNQRHLVKPGLTGWAQINYRYGSTFEDSVRKLQYDIFYIKNQSLLFDLSILFNTIKTVLLRKGT